jgi:ribosomal-protein-alanine N-acetyltransferase
VVNLQTKSLKLVANTSKHILALIESADSYTRLTGLRVADGLREMYTCEPVSPKWLEELRVATSPDVWKHGFEIVHQADGLVIGGCGYKGPPDADGIVEIAYGIAPNFQSRGYATEAAMALIDFAATSGRVRIVRAHTLPEANASTRVLTKCGLKCLGEVSDPDDGIVWRWEKKVTDR